MNAIIERFLGSVRGECLDHLTILGDQYLERILTEYTRYFNSERPQQGLGQQLPEPAEAPMGYDDSPLRVRSVPILAGLHHAYHRAA
jgi:transposase InsO family protein